MTLDQELWAAALWVERTHGENGPIFISEQIGRACLAGNTQAIMLWKEVARRFADLGLPETPPN
jgi:hypothetical protein